MDERAIVAPASIPQEQALNSTSDITLYGGAAGSGKTFTLLITALRFMMVPRSTGVYSVAHQRCLICRVVSGMKL
jgi:hypothetical protein